MNPPNEETNEKTAQNEISKDKKTRQTKYFTEKNVYADTVAGKSNSNWKCPPRCIINFCRVLGEGQRFR